MLDKIQQVFTFHLKTVNQSYFKHMYFSLRLSIRGIIIFIGGFIHAFLPFLFTTTASRYSYKNIQDVEDRLQRKLYFEDDVNKFIDRV